MLHVSNKFHEILLCSFCEVTNNAANVPRFSPCFRADLLSMQRVSQTDLESGELR